MRLPLFNPSLYYVSLGDSISIDAYAGGPGRGGPSLLYKNRQDDFPDWQKRDLQTALPGSKLIPGAMDGATSATVRYAQIPRLKEMNIAPHIVTLTMGGNDLVQAYGRDDAASEAHRLFTENARVVLTELRRMATKDAPLLLGTIYDPSDGTGDTAGVGLVSWPAALEFLALFNDTIRTLATEYDATLTDIHAHFMGHGLRAGNPALPDPRPASRDLWFCGVIEPNAWGAHALRSLWWNALKTAGTIKEPV